MMMFFIVVRQYATLLVSILNINKLEAALDDFNPHFPDKAPSAPADFRKISLDSVKFRYKNNKGEILFQMGPHGFFF